MPTERGALAAGVVGGILYAVGGSGPANAGIANEAFSTAVPFTSFAAKAQIKLRPGANDDSFAVEALFKLGAGNTGINPLAEVVTIGVGSKQFSIPAGLFTPNGKDGFVFRGPVGSTQLAVVIQPFPRSVFGLGAVGAQADLTGMANPVVITLAIGNDAGSTTVIGTFLSDTED
jgi:hypothetical protein